MFIPKEGEQIRVVNLEVLWATCFLVEHKGGLDLEEVMAEMVSHPQLAAQDLGACVLS